MEIDADDIHKSKPRHQWLSYHLEVLCLLYRFYDNSPHEFARIFNMLFSVELLAEGFETGINHERLVSRWSSLKDWSGGHDIWEKINISLTQREARNTYRHLLDDIEDAALELEIPLTLRISAHHGALLHSRHINQKAQRVKEIRGVLGEILSIEEETRSENDPPAKLRRFRSAGDSPRSASFAQTDQFPVIRSATVSGRASTAARYLFPPAYPADRVMRSREVHGKLSKKPRKVLPHLLFRFSDSKSSSRGPFFNGYTGFIAGRFIENPNDIPLPPTGAALRAIALSHLTPELLPTPFISFFATMLPAFHRAIRSSSDPYLTIIDGRIAEQGLKDRFGERTQVAYSVQDIVADFKLELRGGYYGPSEYLMYGAIDSNAIVGILNIHDLVQSEYYGGYFSSILQLDLIKQAPYARGLSNKLARQAGIMSYETGQVIGKFIGLAGVKSEYQEVLARNISRWWRLQKDRGSFEISEKSYINGMLSAIGVRRGNSIGLGEEVEYEEVFLQKPYDKGQLSANDDDMIDQQLEADCPEICANHRQPINHVGSEQELSQSGDVWEFEEGEESPCPRRGSSLNTFATELFRVAEECSLAPQMACVRDWNGSSWRTVTQAGNTLGTEPPTDEKRIFVIDLTGDTEEESCNEATNAND